MRCDDCFLLLALFEQTARRQSAEKKPSRGKEARKENKKEPESHGHVDKESRKEFVS
jgi:hypothetical protein